MSAQHHNSIDLRVHRFAVMTSCVALLPITVGALVTTLKAGMAFADWPTSDGQNMLLYPWLNDMRNTDKFVEHGHRLAGVLIGIVSIALVVVAFAFERRTWVRTMACAILVAVIAQGLLGGMRVIANEQVLAMTHSITGGLFFTLTFLFAGLTKPRSSTRIESGTDSTGTNETVTMSSTAIGLALILPLAVLGQYVLGGMFRHLGRMLHEHVAGAIGVTLVAVTVAAVTYRSGLPSLQRSAKLIVAALAVQVALGLGAWVTKLGFAQFGWVASVNSPAQNVVCTLHAVGGMLLLATSTGLAVESCRLLASGHITLLPAGFNGELTQKRQGGVA
ncbi:MAG: COX15/CtaA family protein [Planctomycetaceae bacterium]